MKSADKLVAEYQSVTFEIARRLVVCDRALVALATEPDYEDNWIRADLVTLQVRKVCEMLLLGSSLAHLHEEKYEINSRKWRPKDSFGELLRVNDCPLPMPIELGGIDAVTGKRRIKPLSRPMPFDTLSAIYGHCGDFLHVPSAEKVLKGKVSPFDTSRFREWVSGLKRLICGHLLILPDFEKIILCLWGDNSLEWPKAYLMEPSGPSTHEFGKLPEFSLLTA